jgi:arabinose-5-phosphate isomerase
MDLAAHAPAERLVDQLMTGDAALAGELLGHDARLEVRAIVRLHPHIGSGQAGADQPRNLLWTHPSDIITPSMSSAAVPADPSSLLATARRALAIEAKAVEALLARLDGRFAAACQVCLECQGRVVVTGMGKSGHVARKVASTLASTGTPAFFLHPAEASHGDLGMITRGDAVLALSNSGETPELLLLLPHLKRLAVPLIVMAGKTDSTLGRAATVALDVSVPEEACPLNLAPTASTTATLAMGDALAVAVLEARGFTKQDFARSHPGGTIGRQLLLHVEQIMRTGEALPRVGPDMRLGEGLLEMSRKGLGMTVVVDEDNRILGVFTDGDLRRALDRHVDVHGATMREVMTSPCKSMGPQHLAAEAVHLMEVYRITALPVADEHGRLIGALNVHDLLRAGVM